jgi:hypothetical protein
MKNTILRVLKENSLRMGVAVMLAAAAMMLVPALSKADSGNCCADISTCSTYVLSDSCDSGCPGWQNIDNQNVYIGCCTAVGGNCPPIAP